MSSTQRRESPSMSPRAVALTLSAILVSLAVTQGLLGGAPAAAAAPPAVLIPTTGAYFGSWVAPRGSESRADAIERVEAQTGRRFAIDHQYYKWDSNFPAGHEIWTVSQGRIPFLNWKAQRQNGQAITWSRIASGAEDGAIAARADAISAFGYPLYLTFHHEPEDDLATWGTPAQYAAAFRRVVDVFRARGVSNVAFVWTMMSWTFDPRSGRDPMSYYPGDGYVDLIGSDGYNFYPGKPGAPWDPFERVFRPTQEFAVARTKPWMAVEYGVQEDPAMPGRKGQWFIDAATVAPTWANLKGLIYFDEIKEYAPNSWNTDTSASSIAGYAALGADGYLSGSAEVIVDSESPVVMVVGDPNSLIRGEVAVVERLSITGHTVTVIDDNAVQTSDVHGARFVMVMSTIDSRVLGSKLRDVSRPVWVAKPYTLDDMLMTRATSEVEYGTVSSSSVVVVDETHMLAAGKRGTVLTTPQNRTKSFGFPRPSADVIATVGGKPTTFIYQAGDLLVGGGSAKGCRLSSSVFRDGPASFTSDAWKMFDAAVTYASSGCGS